MQFTQCIVGLAEDDARLGAVGVGDQLQLVTQVDRSGLRGQCSRRAAQKKEQGRSETGTCAPGKHRRDQDRSSWTINLRSSPASSLQAAVSVRAMNGSGRISAGIIELPCTSVLTLPAELAAFRSQTLAV